MKLVVGLGNPGTQFKDTRHNYGFHIIDLFLEQKGISLEKNNFDSLYEILNFDEKKVIYAKPQTYMNLSGDSILKISNYYKISPKDILVIYDDKDLELGDYKIKVNGSSGGHNGIKDIINKLKTEEFVRLKVGIGNSKLIETKDYVLGKFTKEQKNFLKEKEEIYLSIVNDFNNLSPIELMNKYNSKK